jgi:hypothetical protein
VLVTQGMAYHGGLSFNLHMTDAELAPAAIRHIETKEENSRHVSPIVALQCADFLSTLHE